MEPGAAEKRRGGPNGRPSVWRQGKIYGFQEEESNT